MARFVTFPGTSGSYASTDDVNLLDADSAHLQQSVGQWLRSNAVTNPLTLGAVIPPVFGDTHAIADINSTAGAGWATVTLGGFSPPTGLTAAVAGTQYQVAISTAAAQADYQISVHTRYVDAAFGFLAEVNSPIAPMSVGSWDLTNVDMGIAPANTAWIRVDLRVDLVGDIGYVSGDAYYIDAVCIRAGTDPTFIPSIRIVGSVQLEFDAAATDWSSGGNMFPVNKKGAETVTGYYIRIIADGTFRMAVGSGGTLRTRDFQPNLVDGVRTAIKTVWDTTLDEVRFYFDGSLDSTQGGFGVTVVDPGETELQIGAENATNLFDGDVYGAAVRDGVDGPIVAVFDPDDIIL